MLRLENYNVGEFSLVKSLAGVLCVVDEQLAGGEVVTINLFKALHFLDKFVCSV